MHSVWILFFYFRYNPKRKYSNTATNVSLKLYQKVKTQNDKKEGFTKITSGSYKPPKIKESGKTNKLKTKRTMKLP